MRALAVVIVILALGALVTAIGSWLIGRAHPPRGRLVKVRRLRQHVVELGTAPIDAPPIVLIHGAGVNLEDMRLAFGEQLAARHRVILVGHSWGGALAASFALDYPDRTAALVLLASPLYPLAHPMLSLYALLAMPVVGWIYARTLALPLSLPFVGLALGSAFLPQLPPRDYRKRSSALLLLRPSTFLANARDMADLKRNLEPQPERYPGLAMPTLVVSGASDFVVAPQLHAVTFAAAVPAAKLVILPGIGHMLHHAATEQVLAEIERLAAMMVAPKLTGERGA